MRHLKNFSLFEELDTDAKKDNMMRDSKEKMMCIDFQAHVSHPDDDPP